MIPRRFSPSTSGTPSSSGELPERNVLSSNAPAQTLASPTGHSPQSGTAASPSAASPIRKRSLPLLATPHPIRPRTDPGPLQAAPAVPPRSHAALQRQTQAFSAIAKALGHFGGMRWLTLDETHRQALLAAADLPSAPPSPDVTETEQRQQRLHAMLSSIQQARQDMDRLASRPPLSPRIIEPAMLTAFVPAVHYGQVTIEGPHRDDANQPHFYLEQQDGHACARHALNAMVGGPLVSLAHFAQWEAHRQGQQDLTPAALAQMAADMREQGVHLETVQGTLQEQGMATHCYAHQPIPHIQGLDPVQARFLDELPTDRLLLQADRYEGDSTSSHYVAFRREAGQWVLLDSLHDAPQYGVTPSAYLLGDEQIRHFTALWPQHALPGCVPANESGDGRLEQAGTESMGVARMEEGMPSLPQEGKAGARAKAPRKRAVKTPSKEVQQKFLKGLVPYAAGKSLAECGRESGLTYFYNCLSAAGGLLKQGQSLYSKLPPEQQAEVDQAIEQRKALGRVSSKLLRELVPYAAGENLAQCARESGMARLEDWFTNAGGLTDKGQPLYDKLPPEQQAEVDQAIMARKMALMQKNMETESTQEKFLAGLAPYAAGRSLVECERESGLAWFRSYLSAEGRLRELGQALYHKLLPEQQAEVDQALLSRTVWFAREKIDSKRFLDAIRHFSSSSLQIEAMEQAAGLKKGHLGLLLCDTGLTEAGRLYVEEKFTPQEQEEIERCIRLRVPPQ